MSLGISAGTWLMAGAVVGSAVVSSNAAKSAAETQADAAKAGIDAQKTAGESDRATQLYMYDKNREDQLAQIAQARQDAAPYRQAGYGALEALRVGTAPQGDLYQSYQRGKFEEDPGYQFRLQEGEQGIQRAAAANGSAYSGATLKALARFNSGLASQEYGAWDTREANNENRFNLTRDFRRNNLATLAGIGQTATRDTTQAGATGTGAIGAFGQTTAGQLGQSYINQGNRVADLMGGVGEARASGYVGSANAIGSGLSQLYRGYQQQQALDSGKVGTYDGWAKMNQGVADSQGLTMQDLAGAF